MADMLAMAEKKWDWSHRVVVGQGVMEHGCRGCGVDRQEGFSMRRELSRFFRSCALTPAKIWDSHRRGFWGGGKGIGDWCAPEAVPFLLMLTVSLNGVVGAGGVLGRLDGLL